MTQECEVAYLRKSKAEGLFNCLSVKEVAKEEEFLESGRKLEILRCNRVTLAKFEKLRNLSSAAAMTAYNIDFENSILRGLLKEITKMRLEIRDIREEIFL